MRPFLSDPITPAPPVPDTRPTFQGRVLNAMSSGEWFSRKQLEVASGLGCDAVNTVLQHGLRRGTVAREHGRLRGATKAIVQRYRRVIR